MMRAHKKLMLRHIEVLCPTSGAAQKKSSWIAKAAPLWTPNRHGRVQLSVWAYRPALGLTVPSLSPAQRAGEHLLIQHHSRRATRKRAGNQKDSSLPCHPWSWSNKGRDPSEKTYFMDIAVRLHLFITK